MLLDELLVCLRWVLDPDMSVTHVRFVHDLGRVLVVERHAGLCAPFDWEDVLSLELIVFFRDFCEHLLLDRLCFRHLGLNSLLAVNRVLRLGFLIRGGC